MPGSTANFGWAYPLDTDPLADGAQEIQNFPDGADTDLAGLLGGTTGQALVKDSATDLDFSWQTVSVKVPAIPKVSGVYYEGFRSDSTTDVTVTEDTTYYIPFYVSAATETFDRIIVQTAAAHTGTSTIRLGIYNMGQGVPTTVVLDAGTVSATTATSQYTITINQALTQGWYYLAGNVQTRTGVQSMIMTNQVSTEALILPGVRPNGFANNLSSRPYYTEASITGAFATAGTLSNVNRTMLIGMRFA